MFFRAVLFHANNLRVLRLYLSLNIREGHVTLRRRGYSNHVAFLIIDPRQIKRLIVDRTLIKRMPPM